MSLIMYTPEQIEEIEEFISEKYGSCEFIAHETDSKYIHTDVYVSDDGETKNLVTFGMGAAKMNTPIECPERIELTMRSSSDVEIGSILNELAYLSKYPFKNDTWFGVGHTINVSQDFKSAFGYEYVLFAPTELVFSPADTTNKVKNVVFLSLVPIYEDEREWIVENNSLVYLDLLYNKYGDAIFMVDNKRAHYIPSKEDLLFVEEDNEN